MKMLLFGGMTVWIWIWKVQDFCKCKPG